MNGTPLWIYALGFTAQLLFATRMVIQWVQSERSGKPVSPLIFWQLSLLGSVVFLFYGILRHDFAIVLGQVLVYFIYIRNLHLLEHWKPIPLLLRTFIILAPVLSTVYLLGSNGDIFDLFMNKEISLPLKIWGITGQIIFTLRFYVQWFDSESKSESVLTTRFWLVSVLGSLMILTYAVFRYDPVLLLGQLSGLVVYIRNIILGKAKRLNG